MNIAIANHIGSLPKSLQNIEKPQIESLDVWFFNTIEKTIAIRNFERLKSYETSLDLVLQEIKKTNYSLVERLNAENWLFRAKWPLSKRIIDLSDFFCKDTDLNDYHKHISDIYEIFNSSELSNYKQKLRNEVEKWKEQYDEANRSELIEDLHKTISQLMKENLEYATSKDEKKKYLESLERNKELHDTQIQRLTRRIGIYEAKLKEIMSQDELDYFFDCVDLELKAKQ